MFKIAAKIVLGRKRIDAGSADRFCTSCQLFRLLGRYLTPWGNLDQTGNKLQKSSMVCTRAYEKRTMRQILVSDSFLIANSVQRTAIAVALACRPIERKRGQELSQRAIMQ